MDGSSGGCAGVCGATLGSVSSTSRCLNVRRWHRTRLGLRLPWLDDPAESWWCRDVWQVHDQRVSVGHLPAYFNEPRKSGTGQADKKSVPDGLGRWQQRRNEDFETGLWAGHFCDVWGLGPLKCVTDALFVFAPRDGMLAFPSVEKSKRPNTQGTVLFAHSSTEFALCWGTMDDAPLSAFGFFRVAVPELV
jgi:hypothetical protein